MSVPPYDPPPDAYPQVYEAPRTGMATTSLVLGIISVPTICACVGPLLGLVAVILGLVATVRAGGQPERFGGKGRAIGGIITGVVGVLLVIPAIAAGMAVLATGGVASTAVNMQNIGQALQSYPRRLSGTIRRTSPCSTTQT